MLCAYLPSTSWNFRLVNVKNLKEREKKESGRHFFIVRYMIWCTLEIVEEQV